jgi:flagellar biosynthesis/type III secretory pathway M-ring protein FliF/YscJ
MDTAGRPYRALKPDSSAFMAQTHRDYEHQVEQQIQADIKSHLPSAMVVVRVQARNSDVETEEVRHANPKAVESEERKEVQKGGSGQAPVGIKGEGAATQSPEGGAGQSSTTSETRERSVTDVTKKRERDPAGAIQKITVGVLIPVESGADGKELGEAQKLLPTYKEWVQAAAGPWADAKSVSVQLIPSRRPEPAAAAGMGEAVFGWISANAPKVAMGALALFALVAMLRFLRGAMPKDTVEELSALTAAITQSVESSQAVPVGGEPQMEIPAESDVVRLKTGIKEMVAKNPQSVATSLKAFLGGQAK